eukprot:CAMPEP_0179216976 /NCGR_PEP_ID=MMETSP0797-20121207/3671_1 /TAXON_ID=47934 /ORGANISM="Dinophysis acuminata, Strain DAEP01" /LENGTH=53 /DNA_ID=CAMNT_0020923181 /DNA_START=305 /DNA_END=463 /DNA_ORIENTATION=+
MTARSMGMQSHCSKIQSRSRMIHRKSSAKAADFSSSSSTCAAQDTLQESIVGV